MNRSAECSLPDLKRTIQLYGAVAPLHNTIPSAQDMLKKYLVILVFLMSVFPLLAVQSEAGRKEVKTELLRRLAVSTTAEDSVKALYDLFDFSPQKEKITYGRKIYEIAKATDNIPLRLDMLRQLVMIVDSDTAFLALTDEVETIPDSRDQRETALMIRLQQVIHDAKNVSEAERQKKMAQLISMEDKAREMPTNMRILRLFTIVEYLSNGVHGELLDEYVKLLKERMAEADFQLYALSNILLRESANIYTISENRKEALAADRELLKVLQGLEKKYHSKGRKYRDYSMNFYRAYCRMLNNFPALTDEEVEEYYEAVQKLTAENQDVRYAESTKSRALMYYSIAKKDYATALPLIRRELKEENNIARKRFLLEYLKRGAEATGDNALLVEALMQYNDILKESEELKSAERYKELQIRFDVNELRARNARLEIENRKEELDSYRRMMTAVMAGWVIMAILLFIVIFYWARYRATSIGIRKFVDRLTEERDYLKESQYHDYNRTASDCIAARQPDKKILAKRPRSKRIPDMFNYIINDLMYISSIGNINRRKFLRPFSVCEVMDDTAESVKGQIPSGITFNVMCPDPDLTIISDKECVEYVLHHILCAAAKEADGGEINMEFRDDAENNRVKFIFSTTSVVIPEGNEEVMFNDFIDVNRLRERSDCGLFICRLSSLLLDCTVRLDTECDNGSRYIFSVPKNMR